MASDQWAWHYFYKTDYSVGAQCSKTNPKEQ